jgi:mannose-6-phosphate isomerase-like protein (cupin superfamily)
MKTIKSPFDVRRVVTAERANGSSHVIIDGPPGRIWGGVAALWATENNRSVLPIRSVDDDLTSTLTTMFGNPGETRVGILFWPPEGAPEMDGERIKFIVRPTGGKTGDGWHATYSYDYIFIISGEIWLVLDEEEVHLNAGDVLIQGGVNHTWRNSSGELSVAFAVTIGVPVG